MTEQYAISARFTNSDIYTFIADGCTFGEALAKSLAAPDIQMPLGDMLAQPYADVPKATSLESRATTASPEERFPSALSAASSIRIATGISKLELVIDGLVSSSGTLAGGSGTFNLDTAALSDGVHEVRIVAINNSEAASEGYAAQEIVVNNHGRSVNFTGGNTTMTSTAETFDLATAAGDGTVSRVELTCLGRVVGGGRGAGSLSRQPTGVLAPGDNTIVPVAVFRDGSQVAGGAFVVHEKAARSTLGGTAAGTGLWSNRRTGLRYAAAKRGQVARFGGSASGGTVTVDASASVEEID